MGLTAFVKYFPHYLLQKDGTLCMNMASSRFIVLPLISSMYGTIVTQNCVSLALLVVGENSRQENGDEGEDGEEMS